MQGIIFRERKPSQLFIKWIKPVSKGYSLWDLNPILIPDWPPSSLFLKPSWPGLRCLFGQPSPCQHLGRAKEHSCPCPYLTHSTFPSHRLRSDRGWCEHCGSSGTVHSVTLTCHVRTLWITTSKEWSKRVHRHPHSCQSL